MVTRQIDIQVRDSLFRPPHRRKDEKAGYREGDPPKYRVFIFLDGPDLPYVRSVKYHLHRTFPRPVREVKRTASNPHCMLKIWTWGVCAVRAVIRDRKGETFEVVHPLSWEREHATLGFNDFEGHEPPDAGSQPMRKDPLAKS